jgi:Protein of unknown function (DUF1826)
MSAAKSIAKDFHPSALADIYQTEVAIAIWQRFLDVNIARYAQHLVSVAPLWRTRVIQAPHKIAAQLEHELPLANSRQAFIDDVALLADMFSCLFELSHVGLRIAVLRTAMCPKFHVDRVPCRLLSTYVGEGTEWHLPEHVQRLSDECVNPLPEAIPKNLNIGDVALLKGESWDGNEGRGLVHRSPSASQAAPRLVLTLDFA